MVKSTDKATWWSVTAYGDNIAILEDNTKWPHYVKYVHGGREEAPTTKRVHFQGAIECKTQQRFSALQKWLPGTHLERAIAKEALKKYALKQDTAIGPKESTPNARKFLTMAEALTIVGLHTHVKYDRIWYAHEGFKRFIQAKGSDPEKAAYRWVFWVGVHEHIKVHPEDISLFSQPQMERAWVNSWEIWQARARARGIVLPAGAADPTNEVCWEAGPTDAPDSQDENRSEGYTEDAETEDAETRREEEGLQEEESDDNEC